MFAVVNGELHYKKGPDQISTCDQCQRVNSKLTTTTPKLHPVPVQSPWFHVGIDFVGPVTPESVHGNRYILALSDYFTKWVEAVPLPTKEAPGVAKSLLKIFMRMGFPRLLTSDQEGEFKSDLDREMMKILGIKHHFTTPYHPQANGLDERWNQTLKNMIVKYVSSRKELWDEYLDACLFAYNTSRHESSLHTPFEVMFGRNAVIPIELTYLDPGSQLLSNYMKSSESVVPIDFVGGLNKHRQEILERVEKNISIAQKKQKAAYDRKHANPCKFQVGMEVRQKDFRRYQKKIVTKRINGAHLKLYLRSPSPHQSTPPASPHQFTPPTSPHQSTPPASPHQSTPPPSPHQSTPPASPHQSTPPASPHQSTPHEGLDKGNEDKRSDSELNHEALHEQLYSPHLLRLWRTGACELVYKAEEDDEELDEKTLHFQKDEFALSKDLTVSLWIDYRTYFGESPIREICGGDFVIINDDLHHEFNKFKSKLSSSLSSSLDGTCSVVEGMDLLMFWCTSSKISTKPLQVLEKTYFLMSASDLDNFCQWVYDTRKLCLNGDITCLLSFNGEHAITPLKVVNEEKVDMISMLPSLGSPMELTEKSVRDLIPMNGGARDGGSESSDGGEAREAGSGGGARGGGGEGGGVDGRGGGESSSKVVGDREGHVAESIETVLADMEVDAVLEDVEMDEEEQEIEEETEDKVEGVEEADEMYKADVERESSRGGAGMEEEDVEEAADEAERTIIVK
ncbi:hypothetical protein EMCRGX_G000133 [Ephydatia muelleri]